MSEQTDPGPRPEWIKVGDRVDYHSVIGEEVTDANMIVRAGPSLLSDHTWVVWLDGKAGCVAVEACTPVLEVGGRAD